MVSHYSCLPSLSIERPEAADLSWRRSGSRDGRKGAGMGQESCSQQQKREFFASESGHKRCRRLSSFCDDSSWAWVRRRRHISTTWVCLSFSLLGSAFCGSMVLTSLPNFPLIAPWYTNPQTVAFCGMLELENKINPPPVGFRAQSGSEEQ